jgi:NADH-quinone oxidoreductase subunit E
MATTQMEPLTKVEEIISRYPGRDQDIMAILNDIQDEFNYLPKEALLLVKERLKIPLAQIYSIATFFNAFSLVPKGKHPISVCTGTACHVKGAPRILDAFQRELGIGMGETTKDMKFSLDEVRCLGCCGLAPVLTIGKDLHGKVKMSQVKRLLKKYE